jgi:hypothetical protein
VTRPKENYTRFPTSLEEHREIEKRAARAGLSVFNYCRKLHNLPLRRKASQTGFNRIPLDKLRKSE